MTGLLRLRWDRAAIAAQVAVIAREVDDAYARRPVTMVGVLAGAAVFLADLVRAVALPVEVDFVAVRPVRPERGFGHALALAKDLELDVAGRHVLVVTDVVEAGLTLSFVRRHVAGRDPATLRAATLLDRPVARVTDVPIDHVGFSVGRERLVGYGLDLDGHFRAWPELWEVLDERRVRADPAAAARDAQNQTPGSAASGGRASPGTAVNACCEAPRTRGKKVADH